MLALLGTTAACKADKNKCEAACRNHFTLVYKAELDAELAKAPETCPPAAAALAPGEAERAKAQAAVLGTEVGCVDRKSLKARRNAEFSSRLENGVNLCIEGCVSAGNDDQMDCLIKAKTAKASKACLD